MIKFSKKYKPLFELLQGKHPEVDTVIITGGRGSAKSFVVAIFSLIALVDHYWSILYTRFTNVSITDSIKPEVESKISQLNFQDKVKSTNTHLERVLLDSEKGLYDEDTIPRIAFKGMKTGSGNQTANLKSLFGFNVFIVDEAEEIPDYDTYEKVFLSIRSNKHRNITILILNPTHVFHWIYKHFYEGYGLVGGVNTVKDNVMYIHTSYKDVPREYLANNIVKYYERLKEKFKDKYQKIVEGGWTDTVEGRAFTGWKKITYKEFLELNCSEVVYGIDWGKHDPFGIIECKYDRYKNALYINELHYKSENKIVEEATAEKLDLIRQHGGVILHTLKSVNVNPNCFQVCDANNDNVSLLRDNGYENSYGIDKPAGSILAGVTLLQSTQVYYTENSVNLEMEYNNYTHFKDRLGFMKDKFIDAYNHLLDPARYVRRHFENNR